jgi:hypothetical protein
MEGYQSSLMVEKGEEEIENKVCWARRAEKVEMLIGAALDAEA